jgi:hypothetical protein
MGRSATGLIMTRTRHHRLSTVPIRPPWRKSCRKAGIRPQYSTVRQPIKPHKNDQNLCDKVILWNLYNIFTELRSACTYTCEGAWLYVNRTSPLKIVPWEFRYSNIPDSVLRHAWRLHLKKLNWLFRWKVRSEQGTQTDTWIGSKASLRWRNPTNQQLQPRKQQN